MPDLPRHAQGVLDTSVVVDLEHIDATALPAEVAVSAITMAELAAGPHATSPTRTNELDDRTGYNGPKQHSTSSLRR